MAEIVLIGAGLTGLVTAHHLEQNNYFEYQLFEADATVGGLCRSASQDGFTFDYTGHLLHSSDTTFQQYLANTIGFTELQAIDRRASIYSHDRYTPYPFQTNLYGLPQEVIIECVQGFVDRKKKYLKNPSFHDWVLNQFGTGLGRHFFFPYQQKIFDTDTKQLSASWTGRFVPKTSLHDLLQGALQRTEQKVGYNAQFWYPKAGGIERWIHTIGNNIKKPINTEHRVTSIDVTNQTVHFANGHHEPYKKLVTTLPLPTLLRMLKVPNNSTLNRAANRLLWTKVININLGIARPRVAAHHWVYYPELGYPFYRIGFPTELVPTMAPQGYSSLSIELSSRNDARRDERALTEEALKAVTKLFALDPAEIVTQKTITIEHAYVIFDRWRDRFLGKIHDELAQWNIASIGRYGAWKYASMQEGVLDGKTMAQTLLAEFD